MAPRWAWQAANRETMKPLMIVMGHKAAEPTLAMNGDMFLRQGCDVIGFSPQDGTVFPWPASLAYGRSEHSGPAMIARMHWLLRTAARLSDRIIITEADQLFFGRPLGERKWNWAGLTAPVKQNHDAAFAASWYVVIPWIMDAKTAILIADELQAMAKINGHTGWCIEKGYNDRALGLAVHRLRARKALAFHEIKDHWTDETDLAEKAKPNIWNELALDLYSGKITMVHSIKTAEQYGKLMTPVRAFQTSGVPA